VILYFNYGRMLHAQVMEQMERFMREVAPHFANDHRRMTMGPLDDYLPIS